MTLDVLPLQVRNRGPPPKYSDPDLFSLEIHHGGYISKGKYVRDKVTWADNYNVDHLSMLDMYDVAICLGYDHKKIQYHYWNKRRGFVPIEVDAHVVEFVEHTPTSRVQPLYLSYKHQPHLSESQTSASASAPQLGLEVEVETETDVGDLGNQFVEVDVDGDDEADNEGDNEADEFEDDDSETDIELIDSEFEQSDEEGFKTVLEEDDNLFDKHVVDEENEEYNEEPGEVDSEDYNTDELVSLDEEDDEDEGVKNRSRRRKAPRFKQFRRESDLLKPTFHLGMEFTNMEQCREAIRYYAVSCARPLKWVRNDSYRVRLKCEGDNKQKVPCPWMLYASHVGKGPTTRIKTYIPRHTCGRRQRTKYATSSWLSKRFDEELRDNPKMKVTDFMKIIRKHYAIDVTEA